MELTSEKSCCSAGNNQVDEQAGITQHRWQLSRAEVNGGFKQQVKREEEVGRGQCLILMVSKEETPAQVGNISAASGGI